MEAKKPMCWECLQMWDVEVNLVCFEGLKWCPYCEQIKESEGVKQTDSSRA